MANLALNKPVTVSGFIAPYSQENVVDGVSNIPTKRWLSNVPCWLTVNLGTNGSYNYWINRWIVKHMPNAGWKSQDYNISDFKLQGSNDNTSWIDIDSVINNNVDVTDRTFTAVSYRYVRLYVTKGLLCNSKLASIMELEVYQAPPLSALLQNGTGLVLNNGAFNPTSFVNSVFNYSISNVLYKINSLNVKPTAEDSRAKIKVNGIDVTSVDGVEVPLEVGSNSIKVQVTAADGITTNTYTVTVVREPAVAYLSGLKFSTVENYLVPYSPASFNRSVTEYSLSIPTKYDKIVVTPTTDLSEATITVNGLALTDGSTTVNLEEGNNRISVSVVYGTDSKAYNVNIIRNQLSSNAKLLRLTTSCGTLNKHFDGNVTSGYVISEIPKSFITLNITAEDPKASIKINNVSEISGQPAQLIQVPDSGSASITINVTAEDGITKLDYSFSAMRQK